MKSIENSFGVKLSDIPQVDQTILSKYNGHFSSGRIMKIGDQYLTAYTSAANVEIVVEVTEIGTVYEITGERKNNKPILKTI